MTDPALFDLIDRYGGVLAVWPNDARARAEAAALSDPAFAAASTRRAGLMPRSTR